MELVSLIIYITIIVGVVASVVFKKLTVPGAIVGGLAGSFIYAGGGFTSFLLLIIFFTGGTLATAHKSHEKIKRQLVPAAHDRRNAGQVIANAGVAALLGLIAVIFPVFVPGVKLMIAAAFSSAIADTLSSEIGLVYGKNFYNITSFQKERNGLDGLISLEGSVAGVAGSILIAAIYCIGNGWSSQFFIIVLAGTLGNIIDSILGATVEREGWIGNNAVNFCNTAIAALVAYLFI